MVYIGTEDGSAWTKIAAEGLSGGVWAVDKLIANKGKHTATIPSSLKPGNYLFRAEIIGLHEAETNYNTNSARGAQCMFPVGRIREGMSADDVDSLPFVLADHDHLRWLDISPGRQHIPRNIHGHRPGYPVQPLQQPHQLPVSFPHTSSHTPIITNTHVQHPWRSRLVRLDSPFLFVTDSSGRWAGRCLKQHRRASWGVCKCIVGCIINLCFNKWPWNLIEACN